MVQTRVVLSPGSGPPAPPTTVYVPSQGARPVPQTGYQNPNYPPNAYYPQAQGAPGQIPPQQQQYQQQGAYQAPPPYNPGFQQAPPTGAPYPTGTKY